MELLVLAVFVGGVVWVIVKANRHHDTAPRRSPPLTKQTPPTYRPVQRARPTAPTRPRPTPKQSAINAPTITGRAYVIDGDSLRVKKREIRLFGIDAPEINHPHGKKAKWALHKLCNGHDIRAEIVETDAHGRSVAKCYLPDGRDLSAEMVKQGLAIDWAKFSGGIYRSMEIDGARKKMWLAEARQKGHIHVWRRFQERQKAKQTSPANSD